MDGVEGGDQNNVRDRDARPPTGQSSSQVGAVAGVPMQCVQRCKATDRGNGIGGRENGDGEGEGECVSGN